MTNISFYFKPTFLEKELGKIYLNPNETNTNHLNVIKTHVLKGINLYRKKIKMFLIDEIFIGVLGYSELKTDLDDDNHIFNLVINYNSDTNDYDYYYDREKVNML